MYANPCCMLCGGVVQPVSVRLPLCVPERCVWSLIPETLPGSGCPTLHTEIASGRRTHNFSLTLEPCSASLVFSVTQRKGNMHTQTRKRTETWGHFCPSPLHMLPNGTSQQLAVTALGLGTRKRNAQANGAKWPAESHRLHELRHGRSVGDEEVLVDSCTTHALGLPRVVCLRVLCDRPCVHASLACCAVVLCSQQFPSFCLCACRGKVCGRSFLKRLPAQDTEQLFRKAHFRTKIISSKTIKTHKADMQKLGRGLRQNARLRVH